MIYWWLWVLDTLLVTAAFLFYLATNYGTYEFFGRALLMGLLPLIPAMVLVGGAGSTIFALTKVWIEKRGLKQSVALALLIGQAVVVVVPLVWLGATRSPVHRLSYICAGHAPKAASEVRLAGYSQFLREEWLAVFRTDEPAFQAMVAAAKLAPMDDFQFQKLFAVSSLKDTQLGKLLPPLPAGKVVGRVFKAEEHERGRILAMFDPASKTAVVLREYRD